MPPAHTHPADALVEDLLGIYADSATRLQAIVAAGLRRGLDPTRIGTPEARAGDATVAYRQRQLQQAQGLLAELERLAGDVSAVAVGRSYGAGLVALDNTIGRRPGGVQQVRRLDTTGRFGRIHTRAVESLAANMSASLANATRRAGQSVADVFAAANALDGPLPANGRVAGVSFLGRRVDDALRRVTLAQTAGSIADLDTRRQASARLARVLVDDGVTTALTGFVDRAGRRWTLPAYAAMAARTTTREAMSAATVNRMGEHGLDLVTVSSHPHKADECTPYDGQTFSLTGATAGYDVLDVRPPFHPNCVHVLGPAEANFDDYLAELQGVVEQVRQPEPPPPRRPRPKAPAAKPKPEPPPGGPVAADRIAEAKAKALDPAAIDAHPEVVQAVQDLAEVSAPELLDASGHLLPLARMTDEQRAAYEHIATSKTIERVRKIASDDLFAEHVKAAGADVRSAALKAADENIAALNGRRDALLRELGDVQAEVDRIVDAANASGPGDAAYDEAFERLAPVRAKRTELERQREEVERAIGDADRDALLDALRARRAGYGEGTVTNIAKADARSRELVEQAAGFLPREWVEESNGAGAIESLKLSRGRGVHSGHAGRTRRMEVRDDVYNALHEYGHRIQSSVYGVLDLERAFYLRRVRLPDGALGRLLKLRDDVGGWGYAASEVTRGPWTNSYIGKDYGDKLLGPDPREVLTMGLEGLFGGRFNLLRGTGADGVPTALLDTREALRRRIAASGPGTGKRRSKVDEELLARAERRIALIEHGDHDLADFILGLLATV